MGGNQGSLNSRGFDQQIKNFNEIPQEDHLTYSGIFNEIYYDVGQKAKNLIDLEIGYGKAQNVAKSLQNNQNQFVGIFTKSSKDGELRDDTVLHAVLLLDISGSMGGSLTRNPQNINTRLDLAKTAIEMLLNKMRSNDYLSLITFESQAKVILPLTQVGKINQVEFLQNLKEIRVSGGTIISSGLIEAQKQFIQEQTQSDIESRIIMLTDVGDNSVAGAGSFIQQLIESKIHTTIIGISDEFQSQHCEKLINVEGFNYFCALQETDLIKFLIDNFAYTFFPFASDMVISIQSQEIEDIEVFGTSDHKEMKSYQNSQLKAQNKIIVTRSKSLFPSAIEIDDAKNVKMEGGLILCKTILKQEVKDFKLYINLKYNDRKGVQYNQDYTISSNSDEQQQQQQDFYSNSAIKDGIGAFNYVSEVKNILQEMKNQDYEALQNNRKMHIQRLNCVKSTLPISLTEKLNDTIKFVSNYRND